MNPKSSSISLAAVLVSGAFLVPEAQAALTLTGTSYTQDFDGIGTGLPSDWTVRTGASATALGSTATLTTAATSWADTGASFKNFASNDGGASNDSTATQSARTDRALGIRQSGSFGDPGASFNFNFSSTGKAMTSISFDLAMLSVQPRTTTWTIQYGLGASPTSWTTLGTWADPAVFGQTAFTFGTADFGTALDNQSDAWFRVVALTASGGTGSRDSMAIDDFSMNFADILLSTGYYWLGDDSTRGGSGTWANTGGTAWSTTDADGTGGAWDSSKTAIFNTSAAAVTVSGTVNANKGITFATGSNGSTISSGTIALGGAAIADNTLTTDNTVTANIGTNLTGSTGMTKAGGGTLVLTGAKDYSGGTTISAGTLQLGDGTTNGSILGAITNNASLAVNNGSDQSLSNDISGTGSLTKFGAGNLTLSGTNSYNGGTTLSGGTLTGTTTSLQGAITNNSAITFDQAGSGTYAGNMTGNGSLTKLGDGNVTLSGTNGYSGGSTVSGGTLTGTTTSLQGAITNNATVVFDQAGTGTYAGNMTGSGSLTKLGAGNVTLSGTNGYSGGTTVSGGTLTGTTSSLQGDILNNAAVAYNQSTNGTYAGVMTGTGSLTKSGTGAVTLSAGNGYAGGTNLAGGSLIGTHNTAFGSGNVTITNGSLFAGSGISLANNIFASATEGSFIISEYIEGSSNNKYIELFNGTESEITLADYQLVTGIP